MSRSLHVFAACTLALALGFCLSGHAQNAPAPSLGDAARKAQAQKDKDKASAPAKKVFTNDDLSAGSGTGAAAANLGPGSAVQTAGSPGAAGKLAADRTAAPSASDQLEQVAELLDRLGSLDRTALARNILQGNDTGFPGWEKAEETLFAAKQMFVAQERGIMKKAAQLGAASNGAPGGQNPNGSGAKDVDNQLNQLMQQAQLSSAAFQAAVAEFKQAAGQSAAH